MTIVILINKGRKALESDWKRRFGEWALVTGASSGLGADFVRQLAGKKMNIILVARRVERMNIVAEEVENDYGVKTLVIGQDLIKSDAIPNIINEVGDKELGVLINNAGYGVLGNFHENDYDYQVEMVKLNCVVPVALTHAFIEPMVKRGKGAVIFLASTAAYQGVPFFSVYAATKSFNLFLAEGLWGEYRKKGIDVMGLSPGYTETEFQSHAHIKRTRGPTAAKSEDVVELAIRKLGKTPSVIHGVMNYLGAFSARLMPRGTLVKLGGALMKMMRPGL